MLPMPIISIAYVGPRASKCLLHERVRHAPGLDQRTVLAVHKTHTWLIPGRKPKPEYVCSPRWQGRLNRCHHEGSPLLKFFSWDTCSLTRGHCSMERGQDHVHGICQGIMKCLSRSSKRSDPMATRSPERQFQIQLDHQLLLAMQWMRTLGAIPATNAHRMAVRPSSDRVHAFYGYNPTPKRARVSSRIKFVMLNSQLLTKSFMDRVYSMTYTVVASDAFCCRVRDLASSTFSGCLQEQSRKPVWPVAHQLVTTLSLDSLAS